LFTHAGQVKTITIKGRFNAVFLTITQRWPCCTNLYVGLSFKGFERSELAGTESSWFVWFKTEYELAKFERGLLQAWQELFQVCVNVSCFTLGDTAHQFPKYFTST